MTTVHLPCLCISVRFARICAAHMAGRACGGSRRANCWDNAVTETLFGSLKVERLHGETFVNGRAAKDAVINRVLWYNQKRMHSTIGYQGPDEYEHAFRLRGKAA